MSDTDRCQTPRASSSATRAGCDAARRAEEAGILERVAVEARPPRAEYRLTPRGRQLAELVAALGAL